MADVIQFADLKIKWQRTYAQPRGCEHMNITVNSRGGIVTCDDCQKQLDPVWVLGFFSAQWSSELARLERAKADAVKVVNANLHTKAALRVEEAWRRRTMVPTCPHCHRGIFASDGFGGASISSEIEKRRRAVAAESPQ